MPELRNRKWYTPKNFAPWEHGGYSDLADYISIAKKHNTCLDNERVYNLVLFAKVANKLDGVMYECGVYRGGTASLLASIKNKNKILRLFDTFDGMPETDSTRDFFQKGEFPVGNADEVISSIKSHADTPRTIDIRRGLIPETFAGLEDDRICFAHIDVDIYKSHMDCLSFIYPRIVKAGIILFDDMGDPGCPGARDAIESFFEPKDEYPVFLHSGQGVFMKTS